MSRTKKKKRKSPSERLRGVYYRLYEKNPEGFEEFDLYYENKMEMWITFLQKKLT